MNEYDFELNTFICNDGSGVEFRKRISDKKQAIEIFRKLFFGKRVKINAVVRDRIAAVSKMIEFGFLTPEEAESISIDFNKK